MPLVPGPFAFVAEPVGHGGQEPALRGHDLRPRVQQHETASAVGVLGLPHAEGGLAEEGRLLIPQVAADRHRRAEGAVGPGVPVKAGVTGGPDLRQHPPGDA